MPKASILFLFIALSAVSFAQTVRLSGLIKDENGAALPFVTVYVEGTTLGTTSNADGAYFLDLQKGYHTIVFRSMGYATLIKPTTITTATTLDVVMPSQAYRLKEVQVDGNEDPADRIMRLARKKRKFYQKQVDEYACSVYIKGVNYVKEIPKSILGQDLNIDGLDSTRSGLIYLSESVSELYYKAPNKTTEKVIASKVSGNSQGFTWNNATSIQFNFYDRTYNLEGISDRNLVSPLSPNATMYYRFKYKGFFIEDSLIINRIQVIPRVTGVPLFKGDLFIQEHTWRVHGADLYMTKDAGIDFVDTVRMQVNFIPVNEHVWLKGTMTFDVSFNIKIVKVKGWGTFTSVYSDYELGAFKPEPLVVLEEVEQASENEEAAQSKPREGNHPPDESATPSAVKADDRKQEFASLLKKYNTQKKNGPLIKVESEANELDEAFWDSVRVVPLTQMEVLDYKTKDSIEVVRTSDVYLDSVDRVNNKFKIGDLLFGYQYSNRKKHYTIEFPAMLTMLNFNPVEGYNFTFDPRLSILDDQKNRVMSMQLSARYGLASSRFFLKGKLRRTLNQYHRTFIRVEGGKYIDQYNGGAIKEWLNSLYSVFWETSYMKLYHHSYGKMSWGRELFNGFNFRIEGYYGHRTPMRNATDLNDQFIDSKSRSFEANDRLNDAVSVRPSLIGSQVAATTSIYISYRPGSKYMERPDQKITLGSKYPLFRVRYKRGWAGILGSKSNFDHVWGSVSDNHNLGMIGSIQWKIAAGVFINNAFAGFADQKHFNTTLTLLAKNGLSAFRGLPYYDASTDRFHLEGHVEHHFDGFVFNKIPLIKKLKWQTVAGFHYLYQPDYGHHYEITAGIENIFKVLRADVAFPFHGSKYEGIRFTVSLPF